MPVRELWRFGDNMEKDLRPLYEKSGMEKVRSDIMEVVRENSIFKIDVVAFCEDKPVVINDQRPLKSGEKTDLRVTLIYKRDGEVAVLSEEICHDSGIERVKSALLYRVARAILKERPLGFKE